jgi:F-type H+-transporting ATPase subunit b
MSIHFWELVCFSIFVALIFKPTKKFIIDSLNGYSLRVKNDIDDSCKIKDEALKNLEYYSEKHKELTQLVKEIKNSTEFSIKKLHEDTMKNIENKINNKILIHREMVRVLQKDQLTKLKLQTIRKALSISEKYLSDNKEKSLVKQSLLDTLEESKSKITLH